MTNTVIYSIIYKRLYNINQFLSSINFSIDK
nr:MAG TPA: hypothetical protein [Caudoviricetes sp.]